MPSRGFYAVANSEEGKAAQRDQSYRNCVVSLLIFFILCIILIVTGWASNQSHGHHKHAGRYYNNPSGNADADTAGKTTASTSINNKTREPAIVDSTVSEVTKVNAEETSTFAFNETQWTFTEIATPKTEGALSEATESTTVTTNYSTTSVNGSAEDIQTTIRSDLRNESAAFRNESSEENSLNKATEKELWSTTQTTESQTVQSIAVPKAQVEVVFNSTNSTDAEGAYKSFMNETQLSSPQPVTPKTEETIADTTGDSSNLIETSTPTPPVYFSNESISARNESAGESKLNNVDDRMTSDAPEQLQSTTQEVQNIEATTEAPEQVNVAPANSTLVDSEEASTSASNETQSPSFQPETTTSETNDTSSTTVDYSSNVIVIIKNRMTDEEQLQTTTQNIQNTEPPATEQASITPNAPKEVVVDSANSNSSDVEIIYKYIVNETQLGFSETLTPTSEKTVFAETTEKSSTPPPYLSNELIVNKLNKVEDQMKGEARDSFNSSESTKLLSSTTEKSTNTAATTNTDDTVETSPHGEEELRVAVVSSREENASSTVKPIEEKPEVCSTGTCHHLASRMLFYMNHSADPCDDFYEYACGGYEADYRIRGNDPEFRVYETIRRQAKKHKNHAEYHQFNDYYDSCLKYEAKFDIEHRIRSAKEALEKVGKFYTTADWPKGSQGDFTQLFSNMLLNDRPILFDVVPDVDDANPDTFTLNIGPAVDNKLFQFANIPDQCYSEVDESQKNVDLEELYKNYIKCKDDTRKFMATVKEALRTLRIFDSLNNTYNVSQYIDRTIIDIDLDIFKQILANYPSENEIHELYRAKHYSVMTLGELQSEQNLLDWSQLIHSLTGIHLGPNATIHIYCKVQLLRAMKLLDQFGRKPLDLNNALLGLYARNLYQDLVVARSSTDLQRHCTHIAVHLMRSEASGLYMSSLDENDIDQTATVMRGHFIDLKRTMRRDIEKSNWASTESHHRLLQKVDDIKMHLPVLMKHKNEYELTIIDNYFVNSMNLMKKYRSTMYSVITKHLKPLEQIWTFFASPFEWTVRTIYGLNTIVIPYGAIDCSAVLETERDTYYLNRATIGNLIAREIAHNFDENGFRLWYRSQATLAQMYESDTTKETYEDYTNCHESALFPSTVEISLPASGQRGSFKMPPQSLNERLSEAVGVRLARRTLDWESADKQNQLPWLKLNADQLFYLAYAQTFCTKAPLTSSYVSLHEDPFLPGRIRLFAVIANNGEIGDAWTCPLGSKTSSWMACDEFPNLHGQEIERDVDPA